jgi:hypothetical protein
LVVLSALFSVLCLPRYRPSFEHLDLSTFMLVLYQIHSGSGSSTYAFQIDG